MNKKLKLLRHVTDCENITSFIALTNLIIATYLIQKYVQKQTHSIHSLYIRMQFASKLNKRLSFI